jgi:hypothetical protein
MIFIKCINEPLAQINDMVRIDVSLSFVSGDPITDILIRPDALGDFVSVFNADQSKWYLDWAYSATGTQTITVQATDGVDTVEKDLTIITITEATDNLYSTDQELFLLESELRKYLPPGKNSFLNVHREAQSRIVNYIDRKRIWKTDGTAYSKDELNIAGELSKWSLYEAASIIYSDLLITVGDKFSEKHKMYVELRNYERDRGAIRLDLDGTSGDSIGSKDLKTFNLVRR